MATAEWQRLQRNFPEETKQLENKFSNESTGRREAMRVSMTRGADGDARRRSANVYINACLRSNGLMDARKHKTKHGEKAQKIAFSLR